MLLHLMRINLHDTMVHAVIALERNVCNMAVFFPLLQDLAQGYSSGKLLLKLDAITFMLQHHAANEFPFLDDPANARNRTTLHSILARLLFMEDTPGKFKTFVAPFQQVGRVFTKLTLNPLGEI